MHTTLNSAREKIIFYFYLSQKEQKCCDSQKKSWFCVIWVFCRRQIRPKITL